MIHQDTIVALATPSGSGAIAIIRVSGKDAIAIVDGCFQSVTKGKKLIDQASHTLHLGHIVDDNRFIDEALVSLFKGTNFEKMKVPTPGANKALSSSPPVIPHQIQLRENCLSCHAGPSAPKEIRVTHPERVNCMQCHVPNNKVVKDIGIFKRATNE